MDNSIYQFKILYDTVKFYLPNPQDHIQKTIINNHNFYEYEMLKDIFESLLPGNVIIDVGANIGNHSLFIGKYCNPKKVYSFEPFPYTFNILRKNIEINHLGNKITPIPYAVGLKNTRGNISLPNQNNLGMATFTESIGGDTEVIALDEYFANNLQRLDLIKIDVEGMELDVLKGATNLIRQFHPKIYIECAEETEFKVISAFLSQFDYELLGQFNATPTYSFIHGPSQQEKNNKKKLSFFAGDNNHFHFLDPFIQYLIENGYAATKYIWETNNPQRMLSILKNSDLVWFDWGNGPIVEASNLPKLCPIINRVHKYEIYQDEIKNINWEIIDDLIFVGNQFLDEFKKYVDNNIEQKTNPHIIANPIDASIQFNEHQKGKNIAYISRFHQDKNPLMMVDVLEKLVRIDPEYKIYMIGRVQDEDLYNQVLGKIEQKGLNSNFIYEGIISDVQNWLNDKSYLLSTAKIESQGLGIMEAMLSGIKPVIYNGFGLDIYPQKYRFETIDEAVAMIVSDEYNSLEYAGFVKQNYSSDFILPKIKDLIDKTINRERKHFDYEPLISICIPTYNRAEYLSRSISTALAQIYEKYEIVVVDDGSDDNTEEVIKSFNSDKIRYIRKEHSGIPQTRNRAIEEARGEYILWLDSDDEISPYLLENYIQLMQNYPDADIFYCNLITLDDIDNQVGWRFNVDWYNQENKSILHQIINGIAFYIGGSLMHKKVFDELRDFKIQFKRGQDHEFISRILASNKFKIKLLNKSNYVWHFHNSNISGKMSVEIDKHYERMSIKSIFDTLTLEDIFYQFDWENSFTDSLISAMDLLVNQFAFYNSLINTVHFFRVSNSFRPTKAKSDKIKLIEKEINELKNTVKQIEENYNFINDDKIKKQYDYLKHILEEEEIDFKIDKLLNLKSIVQENEAIINRLKTDNEILIIADSIETFIEEQPATFQSIIATLKLQNYSINLVTRSNISIENVNIISFQTNDNLDSKKTIREVYRLAHLIENAPYKSIIVLSQPDNWIGKALQICNHQNNNIIFLPSIRKELIEQWNENDQTNQIIDTLSKAKTLVSVSENGYDKNFMNEHNLPNVFIPHSVNPIAKEFNFKAKYNLKRKHLLLCVANFWPIKNQANLIKAFINEPGDYDIVIIGNKIEGYENYFEFCNEIAHYDDRITIIPGLPPEEVNEAIKEADLLLIPSLGESAGPLVLLQAMYYKTPWIATPACNAASDEAGGIIADVMDFPKYVRVLLDNPKLGYELGELGYQHSQHSFIWEKSIDAYISLIEGKNKIPDFRMPADIRNKQKLLANEIHRLASNQIYHSEHYVFSIIIPTYNRADVLMMCLDALNKQTFPKDEFEVIIIDDGSNDDTEQKVRNFPNQYKLTYIRQKNSGPSAARNKGILLAKGDYTLILNDDAIMEPQTLEAHFNAQEKYKDTLATVIGTFDYASEFMKRPFVWFTQNTNIVFSFTLLEPNKPFNYRFFWTCNTSIKTSALIEAGMFDEYFSDPMMEDTEIGYRLQKIGYYVYYEPDAKSTHYHWLDVPGFAKRQQMSGRNVLKFVLKHPETLITERAVFGLPSLDNEGIELLRFKREKIANDAIRLTELFTSIDNKLEIPPNQRYIKMPDNSTLDLEELKEQMTTGAFAIHDYNYLTGVLAQLEKQNYDLTYKRKPLSGPETIIEKFIKYPLSQISQIESNEFANEFANEDYLSILKDDYKPSFTTSEQSEKISNAHKPLKILFTMYGWDESGGGTQFPRSIAMELTKAGFDIAIFYAAGKHPSNNNPYYLEEKNINGIHLYGVYNRPTIFLDEANPRREIRDDKVVELFNVVLDREQPDIVHFQNFLGLSFAIAEAAKVRDIPTLFTPHNYHLIDPQLYMFDMENQFKKWKNIDFFQNSNLPQKYPNLITDYKIRAEVTRHLIANQIDYVLAISDNEAKILADYSAQNENIYVINQVSKICDELQKADLRHPHHNPIRFGFIGSILIHKGIHIIYQAAEMLKNEPVEFYLYGVGSPDLINALSKSFPYSKVIYKGGYSENDLFNIAKEVDAVIVPSIWDEGGPLTAPESIAMGLPIIGANIGGIPDFVIDNVNGMLYQYDNPANLANRIQEIIDNPQILDKFKDNLHLNITFQDYIAHISKIYKHIANYKTDMDFRSLAQLERKDIELHFNNILKPNKTFIELKKGIANQVGNNYKAGDITAIYKPLMIHLGSQGVVLEGFENLDAQPQSDKEIQCDVRQLPYPNESADILLAIDLLQVFSHRETDSVLYEWSRVMKKGATMICSVPDLKKILNDYYNGILPVSDVNNYLFGKQMNDYDYHYNGFDEASLQKHLEGAGLRVVELQHQANSMPRLIARAIKL